MDDYAIVTTLVLMGSAAIATLVALAVLYLDTETERKRRLAEAAARRIKAHRELARKSAAHVGQVREE